MQADTFKLSNNSNPFIVQFIVNKSDQSMVLWGNGLSKYSCNQPIDVTKFYSASKPMHIDLKWAHKREKKELVKILII